MIFPVFRVLLGNGIMVARWFVVEVHAHRGTASGAVMETGGRTGLRQPALVLLPRVLATAIVVIDLLSRIVGVAI